MLSFAHLRRTLICNQSEQYLDCFLLRILSQHDASMTNHICKTTACSHDQEIHTQFLPVIHFIKVEFSRTFGNKGESRPEVQARVQTLKCSFWGALWNSSQNMFLPAVSPFVWNTQTCPVSLSLLWTCMRQSNLIILFIQGYFINSTAMNRHPSLVMCLQDCNALDYLIHSSTLAKFHEHHHVLWGLWFLSMCSCKLCMNPFCLSPALILSFGLTLTVSATIIVNYLSYVISEAGFQFTNPSGWPSLPLYLRLGTSTLKCMMMWWWSVQWQGCVATQCAPTPSLTLTAQGPTSSAITSCMTSLNAGWVEERLIWISAFLSF